MNRSAHLNQLRTDTFDVCIIGGGATGAGCALDAASRGLKTALLDAEDFGAVTSGTSTKLVHGGVRYLEQAVKTFDPKQLALVRKALYERKTLLQIAPHLCHPLALLTPCSNWFEGMYYTIGLKLYDLLAGSRRLQPSRYLSRREALAYFPAFDGRKLHSAVLYYDGQFDDIRLNLALVQTAALQGATVANHLRAERFTTQPDGQLDALTVRDVLTGDTFSIRATVFINATGTHADFLRRAANPGRSDRMRASKGAHAILPLSALPQAQNGPEATPSALLVPKTEDGRVLFAIPWRGTWLIGTTDTEAAPTDQPQLLPDEAEYLIDHVNQFIGKPLRTAEITGGFAGLRPLLQADPDAETRTLVRDHEVEIDPRSGLISIMGGKWTTYRLMAQETVDAACRALNRTLTSATDKLKLTGGSGFDATFRQAFRREHAQLPADVQDHLLDTYGTNAGAVVQLMADEPALRNRLAARHPFVAAEVVYAVRMEMARTLPDVLLRRIRLGLIDWAATLEALPQAAHLTARELGWSAEEQAGAQAAFRQRIDRLMEAAGLLETKKA